MYYRCIRFNINQERNQFRDTIQLEQKDLSVLKNGAPDTVQCASLAPPRTSHSRENGGVLRYNSSDCPVCHRTVQ
jgi:hypothetical protein